MNCKIHYLCSGKYTAQNHNISWLTFQFMLNKFLICYVQYILQGAGRALLNFQLKFTALKWVDHLIWHQFVCKRLHSAEKQIIGWIYTTFMYVFLQIQAWVTLHRQIILLWPAGFYPRGQLWCQIFCWQQCYVRPCILLPPKVHRSQKQRVAITTSQNRGCCHAVMIIIALYILLESKVLSFLLYLGTHSASREITAPCVSV